MFTASPETIRREPREFDLRRSVGNRRTSSIHLMGKDEPHKLTSGEELAQVIEQQMNGHSWSMSLTYLGAVRASFAVFFDAQGKVQSVSGIVGPP